MADFTALKTAIQTYIKQNGNEEITGEKLQEILLSVVTTLGDSAINNLVTALANEVAARQNADGTLQQNITNEATARGNADTALGGRIDDEATARSNADTALSNRLGSSITAENTAADQIGAEAEARSAADTALQGLIDGITENIVNGYVYAGIATPSSTPATGKVFYLALTAGTYTNFGNTEVSQGINILKYNGSAWSLDTFIGIDDEPTPNSPNLVKSGGAFDSVMTNGSAFDISAHFASGGTLATYADLNAALTALNTLSASYKKGGMSIKFVLTSDNNYIQARLMANSFTTDITKWQVVDSEPTAGSKNLVESGGIARIVGNQKNYEIPVVSGTQLYTTIPYYGKSSDIIYLTLADTALIASGGVNVYLYKNGASVQNVSVGIGQTQKVAALDDFDSIVISRGAASVIGTGNISFTIYLEPIFLKKELGEKIDEKCGDKKTIPTVVGTQLYYEIPLTIGEGEEFYFSIDMNSCVDDNALNINMYSGSTKVKEYTITNKSTLHITAEQNSDRITITRSGTHIVKTDNMIFYYKKQSAAPFINDVYTKNENNALLAPIENSINSLNEEVLGKNNDVEIEVTTGTQLYYPYDYSLPSGVNLMVSFNANEHVDGININTYHNATKTNEYTIYDGQTIVISESQDITQLVFSRGGTAIISSGTIELDLTKPPLIDKKIEDSIFEEDRLSEVFMGIPKVGIIGDSLSSGVSDNPLGVLVEDKRFAWWQLLKRESGMEYIDFCTGGLTTRSWLTSAIGLTKAMQNGNECCVYYIGLMVNDIWEIERVTPYLGTINDINLSDYTLNADTYYGNYGKIIQILTEKVPNAKFLLMTAPRNAEHYSDYNNAVRDIANLFSNCYLIDIDAKYYDIYNSGFILSQKTSSNHYMAAAYQVMGKIIKKETNIIISENASAFKAIQFAADVNE